MLSGERNTSSASDELRATSKILTHLLGGPPHLPHIGRVSRIQTFLADRVRSIFRDPGGGSIDIRTSDAGLLGADAVSRKVHGDVTTMMIGGVASLFLQMLHPRALAGVWDHSNFRDDMGGRLRRTASFIAVTTYAETAQAEAAIARVRTIHEKVAGTAPDGTPYRADEPALLAWVHAAETTSFLSAYRRYRDPMMTAREQDRYFAEQAIVARALGADPVPETKRAMAALIEDTRSELATDDRTREVARILLHETAPKPSLAPFQMLLTGAALDLLPRWARRMHDLPVPRVLVPGLRGGTLGVASAVRWAMKAG